MGFAAPRSLVCEQVENLLGRPRSALIRPFPADLAVFLLTVPRPCGAGAHPPSSFSSPSAFTFDRLLSVLFRAPIFRPLPGEPASAFLGVSPSSRRQPAAALMLISHPSIRVLSRVTPSRTCPFGLSRPRRFARPRRLAPLPALRACFIPLPRTGFILQGFIPRFGSVPGFPGRFPLLSLSIRLCGCTRSNSNTLGFRGFLPNSSAVTCVMGEITPAPRPSWTFPPSGLPVPSPDISFRICLRLRSSPR
jgi:hypothetical protein